MKECDNSKIHISSNFKLSISLLTMFDTLLLRPSLYCNTPLHFTPHPTTLYYTSPHFTQLHFTTLHHTSPNYTLLNFTQLHFTTLINTSLPPIYTSLPFHLDLRIYVSYRSNSPRITKLDTVQFSHLQTYFQNNKPLHCPAELLTISLHFTFNLILLFSLILSTLHFTSLCYS
jgi:hypothetical protein